MLVSADKQSTMANIENHSENCVCLLTPAVPIKNRWKIPPAAVYYKIEVRQHGPAVTKGSENAGRFIEARLHGPATRHPAAPRSSA